MRACLLLAAAVALFASTARSAARFEAVASVAVRDRATIVNGNPTFLFGLWATDPNDGNATHFLDATSVDELAANTLIEPPTALARAVEGRAWVLVASKPGTKLEPPLPNELGVSLEDEPETKHLLPDQVAPSPRDGRLTYENFANLNDANDPAADIHQGAYPDYVANLGPNAAVTFDHYVYNRDCGQTATAVGSIYNYTLTEKRRVTDYSAAGRDTPVGAWIETVRIDKTSCPEPPSAAEVVAEAKAAVTAGATIVNWWTWSWLDGVPDQNAVAPDVAAAIRAFVAQVNRLAPILLAPQLDGLASSPSDPLKVGGRVVAAPEGRHTVFLILFNSSDQPLRTTRRLPGLFGSRARDAVSGRRLRLRSGFVSVLVPAYDWRILAYASR